MKALIARRLSGLDALAADEVAAPSPGAGEILIGVGATGLHLGDAAAVRGERHPRPALPFIPGMEVAGIVAAIGEGAEGFRSGDRVAAFLSSGGLAEGAVAKAGLAAKLPDGMALSQAAGLPLTYAGALLALRDKARIQAGETLLVLGAGGGAGLAAVEIGKQLGARVIAVASGEARGSDAGDRGADDVVDAAARPLTESIASLTGNKGAHVIFDPVGGDAFELSQLTLARGGRIISAGFAGGRVPRVNMSALFARDAALIAANTPLAAETDPARARAALEDVIAWAAAGTIRPKIAAQFTLADAKPAFEYVMARRNVGAVIVTVGKSD